jgi:hypothetical protein
MYLVVEGFKTGDDYAYKIMEVYLNDLKDYVVDKSIAGVYFSLQKRSIINKRTKYKTFNKLQDAIDYIFHDSIMKAFKNIRIYKPEKLAKSLINAT